MQRSAHSKGKTFANREVAECDDLTKQECEFCGTRLTIEEVDELNGACNYCAKKWRDVFDPRI